MKAKDASKLSKANPRPKKSNAAIQKMLATRKANEKANSTDAIWKCRIDEEARCTRKGLKMALAEIWPAIEKAAKKGARQVTLDIGGVRQKKSKGCFCYISPYTLRTRLIKDGFKVKMKQHNGVETVTLTLRWE